MIKMKFDEKQRPRKSEGIKMKNQIFFTILLLVIISISGCTTKTQEENLSQIQQEPFQPVQEQTQPQQNITPQVAQWKKQNVACNGEFFDTHAHFDGLENTGEVFGHGNAYVSLTPKELAQRMSEHKVGCGILFISSSDLNKDYDAMRESMRGVNAGFLPFINVFGSSGTLSLDSIKDAYNSREEAFFGIGEYAFYVGPLVGTSFTADPWPTIYEYAAEKDLFLMLHPTQQQANEIDTMLSKYPNTKVILHGHELLSNPTLLENLLRNHKNLYFTYDLATMFDGYLYRINNSTEFISWYDSNKQQYLNSVRSKLLPLLKAAPDRMMWGTDVVAAWHGEPAVYSRLMEFSRELVDSLPAEHQDNFAHANAVRTFGSTGIKFEKQ